MVLTTTALRSAALIFSLNSPLAAMAQPSVALPQQSLQERVAAKLAEAGSGTRFGLVVTTEDGRELIAIAPDERFIPASNTKMFTTAAVFARSADSLSRLRQLDAAGGASVRLDQQGRHPSLVVLKGYGDARLSSAPDCITDCLATLADAVASKTRVVGHIVGDDTYFPDQRWSPGMSWNNLHTRYGTAASALTLDDNELLLRVTPAAAGQPPKLDVLPFYTIENLAVTTATGPTKLEFERLPGSRIARLTGVIAAGATPEILPIAIDDPAYYAAWRFKIFLQARGVRVTGELATWHRPLTPADDPAKRQGAPFAGTSDQEPLARLTPQPLIEDLVVTNKVSQNLHAELLLRRVGREKGSGSIADGVATISAMLERAGVPRAAYDFSDGSGMSTYNRVGPRGMVTFLRWISNQPWSDAWRATLPVAGIDGTLSKRFRGTILQGRLFAKTGTLNASNALSGYMISKSGRKLSFSAFANDVPESVGATKFMDAALVLVAGEN